MTARERSSSKRTRDGMPARQPRLRFQPGELLVRSAASDRDIRSPEALPVLGPDLPPLALYRFLPAAPTSTLTAELRLRWSCRDPFFLRTRTIAARRRSWFP